MAPENYKEHVTLLLEASDHTRIVIGKAGWEKILEFLASDTRYKKLFPPGSLPTLQTLPQKISRRDCMRISQIMATEQFMKGKKKKRQLRKIAEFFEACDGCYMERDDFISIKTNRESEYLFEDATQMLVGLSDILDRKM